MHRFYFQLRCPVASWLSSEAWQGLYTIHWWHTPFSAADGGQSRKPQSIPVSLDTYLQATEQNLGVEFFPAMTCLQFQCLHPRQVLLAPFIDGEKWALSYGAIHVSVIRLSFTGEILCVCGGVEATSSEISPPLSSRFSQIIPKTGNPL